MRGCSSVLIESCSRFTELRDLLKRSWTASRLFKADIPLLDNKIWELNPTYISPLLWLWQPLRKDRLLSLFYHTTSVSSTSCAHKQLLSLFFSSMFQTAEHPKSLAGLSRRQLLGAQDYGNKSSHLGPKYGFRRLTLASDFFKLGMVLKCIHGAS